MDLFNREKLAGIEVHPHVNPPESAAADQLPFSPPNRRRLFLPRRRSGETGRRLVAAEESDPRAASDAGVDLPDESA